MSPQKYSVDPDSARKRLESAVRYVAIGDSFSEGVGDVWPDDSPRGWADLVAQRWSDTRPDKILYSNFAIRGRLAAAIIEEQLEPALALAPTHLSFAGGGNDVLRPRADIGRIADLVEHVVMRCCEEGVVPIVLSPANPARHLPFGRFIQRRGDQLCNAVLERIARHPSAIVVANWPDLELTRTDYWDDDGLHLNELGHRRVAARTLTTLGVDVPARWWKATGSARPRLSRAAHYREYVLPWVERRIRRVSSGDGVVAKHPGWTEVA